MKARRYQIKAHDDGDCDQCGYPMDPGDYGWVNDLGALFCSPSCAARWDGHQDHGKVLVDLGASEE